MATEVKRLRPTRVELEALFWRSVWTAVATFIGGITSSGLGVIEASAVEVAGMSAVTAVLGLVLIYARQKLGTGGL